MNDLFINVLAIALFTIPGFASELHYLSLVDRKFCDNRALSIIRALSFSAIILLFRCVISMPRGYSDLVITELFFGIGNVGKYIALGAVLAFLLPNAYFLVNYIYGKIMTKIQSCNMG